MSINISDLSREAGHLFVLGNGDDNKVDDESNDGKIIVSSNGSDVQPGKSTMIQHVLDIFDSDGGPIFKDGAAAVVARWSKRVASASSATISLSTSSTSSIVDTSGLLLLDATVRGATGSNIASYGSSWAQALIRVVVSHGHSLKRSTKQRSMDDSIRSSTPTFSLDATTCAAKAFGCLARRSGRSVILLLTLKFDCPLSSLSL